MLGAEVCSMRAVVAVVSVGLVLGVMAPGAQERVTIGGGSKAAFPPPPISAAQAPEELSAALDRYLAGLAAEDRFSGVVLVARDGRAIFERAYGLADRASQVPNTVGTRFNLSSVNKVFTMAAIEQLKAAGRLKGEDTIGALLPDYPNEQGRRATVEQLLAHRGGISDFFGPDFVAASPRRFRSNADYFAFVAPRPLYFEPGSQRRYCNGCYIVLGEIVARVSGVPYEQYMRERIFAPRGMTHTDWLQSDGINERVATGYTRGAPPRQAPLRANLFDRGAAGSAAGGGFSTAADLLAFLTSEPASAGGMLEGRAISGGSPGSNALVESRGPWTVIVLSNIDPPSAAVGEAILQQLK
jgi:D-alanyl-D-alanine carboxypeptidase